MQDCAGKTKLYKLSDLQYDIKTGRLSLTSKLPPTSKGSIKKKRPITSDHVLIQHKDRCFRDAAMIFNATSCLASPIPSHVPFPFYLNAASANSDVFEAVLNPVTK